MCNLFKWVWMAVLAVVLAACGGGGGSSGNQPGDTTGPTETPKVSDVVFELNKTTISNSGSDSAELKVLVLDAKRNVLPNIPVEISLNSSGLFQKSSGDVTNAQGVFSGSIGIGGDKSNREIEVVIRVAEIVRRAFVRVQGVQIVVSPVPAAAQFGQVVAVDVSVLDSVGSVIPNVDLQLKNSVDASVANIRVGLSGKATYSYTVPSLQGLKSITLTASGLGTQNSAEILVLNSDGTGQPDPAIGTVSASSLTANPSTIQPNKDSLGVNRAKLTARFQDKDNNGIQNIRVRFNIQPPSLGSDERISTGSEMVYTNSAGVAESDYISGLRTSPTNGVVVRACWDKVSFNVDECPNSVSGTLTVAGSPLSITIGDNNLLEKGLGNIAYIKKFLIQVNDAAGVAVKDAVVSVSVDITHYGKAQVWGLPWADIDVPNIRHIHKDYVPSPPPANYLQILTDSNTDPSNGFGRWCLNEDWNRNGFLDVNEDVNLDGVIQPKKAEIIVSYVSGNKTDQNGQMLVQVAYPQNMGRWLAYTLRATTSVAGSEGDAAKSYVTDVLQADVQNGSFLTPPFGVNSCTDPN